MRMALLRTVIDCNRWTRIGLRNQGLASILHDSPMRCFSTDQAEPQSVESPAEPFLETPNTCFAYVRLAGICLTRHTRKSDILNLLEGCNLSLDDVKVDYSRNYTPNSIMVKFPSRFSYDAALKAINRKGRLFRMERGSVSQWDLIAPFNSKAVVLQGIPYNALQDDVERFLEGCEYDASSIKMFARQSFPDSIRMALVQFPTKTDAMHAVITKNRGFCLNNQILVWLLQ